MLTRIALVLSIFAAGCIDDAPTTSNTQLASTHDHRPPPREAFAACTSSAAGDSCAFDIDGHHVTGTCKSGPDGDGPLACAPDLPPPPPESLAACASLAVGDACAFDIDGHHVDGACRVGPDASAPLGCAPSQPPPPPH